MASLGHVLWLDPTFETPEKKVEDSMRNAPAISVFTTVNEKLCSDNSARRGGVSDSLDSQMEFHTGLRKA